jgi:hypothetical protein
MEQTAKVSVSDLQSNDVLVAADDEQTNSLWLRSLISSAEGIPLEPTQRFLHTLAKEQEWVTSLNDAHRQQRIAQLCILEWKNQNPPGRFLRKHPSDSGWYEQVDGSTVEHHVLRYFASWTDAPSPGTRYQGDVPALGHRPYTGTSGPRSDALWIAKKILKAREGNEFKKNLKNTYKCELKDCVIDMKEWLNPLTSENPETKDRKIDLEPLQRQLAEDPVLNSQLNGDLEDLFLPRSIYVRHEMRGIFKLFCRDVNLLQHNNNDEEEVVPSKKTSLVLPRKKKTILLGSPGVGKSILFFLAALYRSQTTVTIYIRRTAVSDEDMSVFVMFPEDFPEDDKTDRANIRVLFTRSMKKRYTTTGLSNLIDFLEENLQVNRREYYIFLDGPRYNESKQDNTLEGDFDFLCTSAGYPDFKHEEQENSRRWCLNGWTADEAKAAFVQMHGDSEDLKCKAQEVYDLCGGKIRGMCHAFDDYEEVRRTLIDSVQFLTKGQVEFSLYESSSAQINKLGIVFRDDHKAFDSRSVTQFVDSKFLWKALSQKLGLERFVKEYDLADKIKNGSLAGWHFESTVHAWFLEVSGNRKGSLIKTVSSIDTSFDKNDKQLIKTRNVYWIPPSVNFPNIDSAIVINKTLFAFQVTISKSHTFQASSFFRDFLETMKALEITSVQVCVITTQEDFAINQYLGLVQENLRSHSTSLDGWKHYCNMDKVPRDCWVHPVDIKNVESFRQSMGGLLEEILKKSTSTTVVLDESIIMMSSTVDVPENRNRGFEEEESSPPTHHREELPPGHHLEVDWNSEMAHPPNTETANLQSNPSIPEGSVENSASRRSKRIRQTKQG